jgi:hypothetical protein
MANWSGTITFTAPNLATGTAVSGTASLLVDTGNTFKIAGAGLTNYTLRMLTGTPANINQERVILSNTSTSISTVSPFPAAIAPGDTYEIVLKLGAGSAAHITGNLICDSGTIVEAEDSTYVHFDGLYYVQITNSAITRLGKTKQTMVTWGPTTGGANVQGFWNYVYLTNTLTIAPQFSYHKAVDCTYGLLCHVNAAGDLQNVHHLWVKNSNSTPFFFGALVTPYAGDKYFKQRLVQRNSSAAASNLSYSNAGSNTGKIVIEDNWFEDVSCTTGLNIDLGEGTQTPPRFIRTGIIRNNVMKRAWYASLSRANNDALARTYFLNNYLQDGKATATAWAFYHSSISNSGISYQRGNVLKDVRLQGQADYHATVAMSFNDCFGYNYGDRAYIGLASQTNRTGDVTSDRDYIAGWNFTPDTRADLSNATTSTESPQQYQNLNQPRTNARSAPNKALVMDNVVVGTPTDTTVTITFDCKNGDDLTSSTVNVDSNSGQNVLNVSSTTGFIPEQIIEIGHGTARFETGVVSSVGVGTLTLYSNLIYTHTAAQADTVKLQVRHKAIGGIMWGTSSGIYDKCTRFPNPKSFGAIYLNFVPEIAQDDGFEFKATGHSITLDNLEPAKTYYFKAIGVTPFEDLMYSTEQTFTTDSSSIGMPAESDVRDGVIFGQVSELEGTLDLPPESSVEDGYVYDNGTKTGTLETPDADDLRLGITVGSVTGTVRVPTADKVKVGELFDASDSETGTYDGSERYTDVPEVFVVKGFDYRYNSLTDNREGDLDIAEQVWNAPLSSHNTPGTFGTFVKKILTVAKFLGLK